MKRQVFAIHGGDCFETNEAVLAALASWTVTLAEIKKEGWSRGLQKELPDFDVYRPDMPNKLSASYDVWKAWFEKFVPEIHDGVILVGHSLGGMFLVRYLAENTLPARIASLHLVATPFNSFPEGAPFGFLIPGELENISKQAPSIYIYASTDDMVVPFKDAEEYANALPSATLVAFEDRGHFNQPSFPELIANIR